MNRSKFQIPKYRPIQ